MSKKLNFKTLRTLNPNEENTHFIPDFSDFGSQISQSGHPDAFSHLKHVGFVAMHMWHISINFHGYRLLRLVFVAIWGWHMNQKSEFLGQNT